VYASRETEFDIASTCRPASILIGNVIFHTSLYINIEFDLLNRASKARIEFSGVRIVGIYQLSQYCKEIIYRKAVFIAPPRELKVLLPDRRIKGGPLVPLGFDVILSY
jgi:hypothetical protein